MATAPGGAVRRPGLPAGRGRRSVPCPAPYCRPTTLSGSTRNSHGPRSRLFHVTTTSEHRPRRGPTTADGGLLLFRVDGVPVLLAPSWWVGSLVMIVLYEPMVS